MLKLLLVPLAALLAITAAGPATANTGNFGDNASMAGPMDIQRVTVKNEKRLTIRVIVEDLQKKGGRSASVRIDTNAKAAGPEFVVFSGLRESDWQIVRVKNWKTTGGPLNCPSDQGLNYADDVIRWTTGPACLGKYGAVRVSATTQGAGETDHSPGAKSFHSWVKRY